MAAEKAEIGVKAQRLKGATAQRLNGTTAHWGNGNGIQVHHSAQEKGARPHD